MSPKLFQSAVAIVIIAAASPAFAAKPVAPTPTPAPPPSCNVVTFDVPTVNCLGFYEGNLIADSGPKLTEALGYVGTLDPSAPSLIKKIDLTSNPIDFGMPLSGQTLIGIHFGGGRDGYNGTGFWLLNLPTTVSSVSYSSSVESGLSNAGLYLTGGEVPHPEGAVPEPGTWAMMLLGFGAVGAAMRKRTARVQRLRVAYA
jgi:hypothetical protein